MTTKHLIILNLQTTEILPTHASIVLNQYLHAIYVIQSCSNVSWLVSILVELVNIA